MTAVIDYFALASIISFEKDHPILLRSELDDAGFSCGVCSTISCLNSDQAGTADVTRLKHIADGLRDRLALPAASRPHTSSSRFNLFHAYLVPPSSWFLPSKCLSIRPVPRKIAGKKNPLSDRRRNCPAVGAFTRCLTCPGLVSSVLQTTISARRWTNRPLGIDDCLRKYTSNQCANFSAKKGFHHSDAPSTVIKAI